MSEHLCVSGCGRPTTTMLCTHCTDQLVTDLRSLVTGGKDTTDRPIPGLLANLDETRTRQHVLTDGAIGVRSRSASTPLPYHETAAEVWFVAGNTLTTWARDVAEYNSQQLPPTHDTPHGAAAWLAKRSRLLALHPAADELHDELIHVVAQVRRVVDRARQRIYLGPCTARDEHGQCGADLYGIPERAVVTCPDCGTNWDINQRRTWLLEVVEDQLATAAEISRALPHLLGQSVTAGNVRDYASRGRIVPHGRDGCGYPRYRLGDVIDLVTRIREGVCA